MKLARRSLLLVVLTVIACGASFAQVTTGMPPFGAVDAASGPDVIDLANLNAHIAIPVLHKAGRGTDFTYDLSYDSSVWYPVASGSTTSWQPVSNWGWRGATEVSTGYVSYVTSVVGTTCGTTTYGGWIYHDTWGVPHPLAGAAIYNWGPPKSCGMNPHLSGFSSTAADGSGYSITVNSGNSPPVVYTLYSRSGQVINAPANTGTGSGTFTDRNGNEITVNTNGQFFDTLSSMNATLTVSGTGTPLSPMKFTYTAPSGAQASYTLNYTNYTVATNFGLSGTNEYKSSAAVPLVTSIVLPDGSQYSIQYEATPGSCTPYAGTTCVTARINSVTLPTGGSITYTYTGGHNGVFSDGSTAGLTRALSDGASWSATWIYSRLTGTGAASETTVTAPRLSYDTAANQSILQFQGIYETQSDVYQGSAPTISSLPVSESTLQTSNLLQEVQTCYNGSPSPCISAAVTMPISSQTVINILPGSTNLESRVATSYNSYGQLAEEDDYDFGSGAPGNLIRKKLITIQTVGTYQAIQTARIQDGSGHVLAQTQMTFDQGSVVATSGTPQWQNPTVGRGNPTTISYLVGGSTSLTKTLTYFDTGNVQTITDVNGGVTMHVYGTDLTKNCGNSFPVEEDEAISGLKQLFTWNCTGGVAASVTDENSKTASTSYTDAYFWRPASTTDLTGTTTNFCYGVISAGTCAPNPNQTESTLSFNSGNSVVDTLSTSDGLAHSHLQQTRQSPTSTNFDSTEIDYDSLSRPYRVTAPYQATASQTCSSCTATTTTFDALGRASTVTDAGNGTVSYTYTLNDVYQSLGPHPSGENTKDRQLEYDGLGRLTSVCEITTTLPGNGTCGQNTSKTGYWTKYTYDANGNLTHVTQNAQSGSPQTRGYSYDDLSRMTSETNPELGASGNGTINYTYDSDSTCGTYTGDLVKILDAAGNVICNTYDALHRNTGTTYPSGPNSSVTPSKSLVYDSATVGGVVMGNAKGRLAEAYTGPSSAKITDLGLSYTARGETSDVYESTLHSSGYFHVNQGYWANGTIASLSGLVGLTNFNFGADGEGRTSTVYAGSGQNPVTSTTYNLYASPPQVTVNLGSHDTDVFNLDANTWRMTQYKFTVGSTPQSIVGALTWNANGSLGQLAITDPVNSADNQTCNYQHDDLARIAQVDCGSGNWGQSFTYDAFGNIMKNVLAGHTGYSFQPTYSSSTNRFATMPGTTPSYDANGDVLSDGLHQYTWDAEGRPVTIDTVSVTYDALGRLVETTFGSTARQAVYSPQGTKLAIMTGQSLTRAYIPLPGGETAIYDFSAGGGLYFYRHADWLGSARVDSTPTQTFSSITAYAPFGETYATSGAGDKSFTGQEADFGADLFDFLFRQYDDYGRWTSPDPAGMVVVRPWNPQTWNRYAYVMNNPMAMTDPTGLFAPVPPTAGGPCIPCDVVIGIFDIFDLLFGLFGPPPPPQAAPPPPGGYGVGIDPYGTWDEKLPAGVQALPSVFPRLNLPGTSDCTYGNGNCGGLIYSFDAKQIASARKHLLDYLHWLLSKPWLLSWIVPLIGAPGEAGVGPAGSFYYNPQTHILCASLGGGGSVGRNVSVGPLTQIATRKGSTVDDIANGWSISSGWNAPLANVGYQTTGNGAGIAGGPTAGSPGLGGSSTYAVCSGPR